ncbi:5-methyltetrahydropteroyltriglutamate--homocysteine methyltransferase-like [Lineus longissimus]|uniref:5-methyltetrahydropteroyltriglutamate-- homocysteine methyltransferase-like n=1 Tax=Lineus longissimus TaxID=88925 RepID=UPI002B4F777B
MPLQTTTVGSYPKPEYLHSLLPDWFKDQNCYKPAEYDEALLAHRTEEIETAGKRALKEVIDEQIDAGIDVITDGEIMRENYIYHFCRHIKGIDFKHCNNISIRNGACTVSAPVFRGKVSPLSAEPWCCKEWETAQALSTVPVKYTLPGPMTILGTSDIDAPGDYKSLQEVSTDIVPIINKEILALVAAGCKYIQVDEPLIMRRPDIALDYGMDHLMNCFKGVPSDVHKISHLCCGYPHVLDQVGYPKDKDGYLNMASKLDNLGLDQISLEDAHRNNCLGLFENFKKTKLIVGVVKIASSRIETEEEIENRVREILKHLPREQLILAPDCGLGFLVDKNIRLQKLKNMVAVAKKL